MATALDLAYDPAPMRRGSWRAAAAWARAPAALAALLVAGQLALVFSHVHWRDEAQAYLIVRDAGSIGGVLKALHYEGHPGAWYLLLGAVVALVPSLLALSVAQGLVAVANAVLVWRCSPFGPWMRLALLAGYFPLFEYGVIARNYGLGAALLFGHLATRRSLWGWILLGALANVAAHCLLLSAALVLAGLLVERRWSWTGAAVWAFGCGLAVLTMAPAHDARPAIPLEPELAIRAGKSLHQLSLALLPVTPWQWTWGLPLPPPAGLGVGLLTAAAGWLALGRRARPGTVFLLFYAALFAMGALLYPIYARHVGLLVLLLVALEWMRLEGPDASPSPLVFRVWIGWLAVTGVGMAGLAATVPFASADRVAGWVQRAGLADRPWAAYPAWHGLDLTARLGRPTYDLQKRCMDTFQRWNYRADPALAPAELRMRLAEVAARQGGTLYLLSDQDPAMLRAAGAAQLANFKPGLFADTLATYVVRAPPTAGPPPPPCR